MRRRFWSDTRDLASTKLTTSRPPFRYLKVRVVDLAKAGKGQLLMLDLTWGLKAITWAEYQRQILQMTSEAA